MSNLLVTGANGEIGRSLLQRLHQDGRYRVVTVDLTPLPERYRGFCLEPMGLHARHFRQCAAMLSSVRVYAVTRQWGFDGFEREVDRLEQHLFEEGEE